MKRTFLAIFLILVLVTSVLAADVRFDMYPTASMPLSTSDVFLVWQTSPSIGIKTLNLSNLRLSIYPSGSVRGDILIYNGSSWTRLGAGTSGQFLQTRGTTNDPWWQNALTGSGTTGYWAYWNSASSLAASNVGVNRVVCSNASGYPTACTTLQDTTYEPNLGTGTIDYCLVSTGGTGRTWAPCGAGGGGGGDFYGPASSVLGQAVTFAGTTGKIGQAFTGTGIVTAATGVLSTVTSPLSPAYGGTGKANNAANVLTFTGNYSLGVTLTGNTLITLPSVGGTVLTTTSGNALTATALQSTPSLCSTGYAARGIDVNGNAGAYCWQVSPANINAEPSLGSATSGQCLQSAGGTLRVWGSCGSGGGGSMDYPPAGVPISAGTSGPWSNSINMTGITDSISTASSTLAASATAVRDAYNLANSKQASNANLTSISALSCGVGTVLGKNSSGAWACLNNTQLGTIPITTHMAVTLASPAGCASGWQSIPAASNGVAEEVTALVSAGINTDYIFCVDVSTMAASYLLLEDNTSFLLQEDNTSKLIL